MRRLLALLGALTLLLAGCGKKTSVGKEPSFTDATLTPTQTITTQVDTSSLFSNRDYEITYDKVATITLKDGSATCDSNAVKISGSTVTITDEGSYLIRGELDNGQIIVDADKEDKTQIILDGTTVHSETSAPIYILQADKVFVTLQGENTLSNGGSFETLEENNIDAVIFSKEDLCINGTGGLTVTSPAGHGIVSKDELTITGGNYNITSASHGIAGKDNVCIDGGTFTLATGKDGIHSENNDDVSLGFVYIKDGKFTISAEGDGISANAWMELSGGEYDIVTGGGSENGQKQQSDNWGMPGGMMPGGMRPDGGRPGGGMGRSTQIQAADTADDSTSIKGIKAGGDLLITGGTYAINSADDGIHSNSNLSVTDGNFTIATGDDGFHADSTLKIASGTIQITESYEGLEGLHIQVQGGDIDLVASDDGLNAAGGTDQSGLGGRDPFGGRGGMMPGSMSAGNGSITITGGNLYVNASGDGIDANGTLLISGGYTVVCGPTQGDTATLDYDVSATIEGGTFIGTGASGMAQTFSDSKQGVMALSIGGSMAAGTKITITDENGNQIISHEPELNFAVLIISTPDMKKGQSYTVTVGDLSNVFEAS